MTRLDELTLKLLDDTISEEELVELTELTKNPDGRATFLRLVRLESHLYTSTRLSLAVRVLAQIHQERSERVEENVMRAVREAPRRGRMDAILAGRQAYLVSSILIGLAAVVTWLVFLPSSAVQNGDGAIAHLHLHGSSVTIVSDSGEVRSPPQKKGPLAIRPNETIEVATAIDTAEVVYADGTRVELLGGTKVSFGQSSNGSIQLKVVAGLIQADVAPQPPERPLQIVTAAATLEVLGTTLGVEVRDASTRLGVATGRVAMTRNVDGQRVEVEAGRFATATESPNDPLQSHPFPELPGDWSEDFLDGLPAGWRSGKLIEFQDATAVKAIFRRSGGGRFVITSQNEWQEGNHGLCRIDTRSVLHLRIRQSTFARITIMIGTRSYPPASGRIGGNLFYTRKAWNEDLPPDTWKNISIPIQDVGWHVKQGERTNGAPDLNQLAAYLIHITTQHKDSGLIVDRIWITSETDTTPLK